MEYTGQKSTLAIDAGSSLYLNNVFCRNTKTMVHTPQADLRGSLSWKHVVEAAFSVTPMPWKNGAAVIQFQNPIFENQNIFDEAMYVQEEVQSPEDISSMVTEHCPENLAFEYLDDSRFINVKDYAVRGDGIHDDTTIIRNLVASHDYLFFPKGIYLVNSEIQLGPNTKVVGAGKAFTTFLINDPQADDFDDDKQPRPLFSSPDEADAHVCLEDFNIFVSREIQGAYALLWRSGGQSQIRNIQSSYMPGLYGWGSAMKQNLKNFPMVKVTGHGGGNSNSNSELR